jgi:hypothetical protein
MGFLPHIERHITSLAPNGEELKRIKAWDAALKMQRGMFRNGSFVPV